MDTNTVEEQIAELERRLAEARGRLPRHSLKPLQLIEIEELEEELDRLRSLHGPGDAPAGPMRA